MKTFKTFFTTSLLLFGNLCLAETNDLNLIGKCHYFDGDSDDPILAEEYILPGRPFLYLYQDENEKFHVIHSIANKRESLTSKEDSLTGELEPILTEKGSSLNDLQWKQLNLVTREVEMNDLSLSLTGVGAVRMAVGRPTNFSNQQYPNCIVFE